VLPDGRTLLMSVAGDATTDRWDKAEIVAYSLATGKRKTIIKGGGAPRYLASGHLLYAIGNNVLAVPFDAKRLEVRGGPVPVIDNVRRVIDNVSGAAQFAVSDAGDVTYVAGIATDARQSLLALVDRAGGKPQA